MSHRTCITLLDLDGAGELKSPTMLYGHKAAGQYISTTDRLERETIYDYDGAGRLISTIDQTGETVYAYDGLNRLIEITPPDSDGEGTLEAPVTTYEYDNATDLVAVVTLLGTTSYEYDHLGRTIHVTSPDPDGEGGSAAPEVFYAYDALSRLVSYTSPLGIVTLTGYDELGRATSTRQIVSELDDLINEETDDIATTFGYDKAGNQTSVTNPLLQTTTYGYDNLDRLITQTLTDPDGVGGVSAPVTHFAYDSNGNRLSLTDPVGNLTAWVYDELNRVISEENENGDFRYFGYDKNSNLIEETDRKRLGQPLLRAGAGRALPVGEVGP